MTKKIIYFFLTTIFTLTNEIKAQIIQPNENNQLLQNGRTQSSFLLFFTQSKKFPD